MFAFLAFAAVLLTVGNCQTKRIVIDVDGAIDDARAVVLAFNFDPKIQILAITCTNSWVSSRQCVLNMNRVLRLLGREDVPVYMGPNQAILSRKREGWPLDRGADAFGDVPEYEPALLEDSAIPKEHAPDALVRLSKEFPGEITVVTCGPLTNLAIAQKLDPYFGSRIKDIYIMGGNLFGVGLVPSNPAAEYNIHMDPEAAYIVFNEFTVPITTLPFETASERINSEVYRLLNTPVKRDAFLYRNSSVSKFLHAINKGLLEEVAKVGGSFGFSDEVSTAAALNPPRVIVRSKSVVATVELHGEFTRGQVAVDWVPMAAALNPPGVIVRSKSVVATVELHGEFTRGQVAVDWVNVKKRKNVRMITEYNPRVVAGMMLKAVDETGLNLAEL